jgi:predicted dehydrogenase
MNRIKIGIIGCGKQAGKHISCLKKLPGLETVLSDIQPDFARNLAKKTDSFWVKHPDEIFADKSIRAVVICTPTQTHVPFIEMAVDTGKDVLCEKPLCETVEEAEHLQNSIARSNQIVMVGYVYRYVPVFEEGFRIFCEQAVNGDSLVMGKPLSAFLRLGGRGGHQVWKHRKSTGGGAINEMLVHMVDLANWYFGPLKDIQVISCDLRYPKRIINGEMIMADAEDYILVRCTGADGIEILCQADLITPAFIQYVEVQTEKGTFMGSIQGDMPSYVFLKEDSGGFSAGKTELKYGRRNVLDIQMLNFVHCILKRELPDRNSIADSLQLVQNMGEIRKQAGYGQDRQKVRG